MTFLRGHKLLLTNLALFLVLVLGGGYLLISIARINPFKDTYTVKINMDRSGGLQPNSDVTYRGFRVGTVKNVKLTEKGIEAEAQMDSKYKVPAGGEVVVGALSAAGEQYIDFRPDTTEGPFLGNDSVIEAKDVKTPVPISQVLDNASTLIEQLDPKNDPNRFSVIVDELDKALGGGPDQLRNLVSGLSIVTAGLDSLLPQTVSLLENLRVIAGTTAQIQPDLQTLTDNSDTLFTQFTNANAEVQRFLDNGAGQVGTLGGVAADTADPVTNLATNFLTITKAARLRTPALKALFPWLDRGLSAIGVVNWDGELHAMATIWSRPTCEYAIVPKTSPLAITDGTVNLWNYCPNINPNQLIRGSNNAPRPDIPNNGSQMPPGVDPAEKSTPLGPGYP